MSKSITWTGLLQPSLHMAMRTHACTCIISGVVIFSFNKMTKVCSSKGWTGPWKCMSYGCSNMHTCNMDSVSRFECTLQLDSSSRRKPAAPAAYIIQLAFIYLISHLGAAGLPCTGYHCPALTSSTHTHLHAPALRLYMHPTATELSADRDQRLEAWISFSFHSSPVIKSPTFIWE